MKKTTVLINEHLLEEAKKAVGAHSTREVIETGLYALGSPIQPGSFKKRIGHL